MEGEGDTARLGASGNRVWIGLHGSSSFVWVEGGVRGFMWLPRGV